MVLVIFLFHHIISMWKPINDDKRQGVLIPIMFGFTLGNFDNNR